ncbi:MAG: hypothetical protein FJY76_02510 [Candidatus Aenigmarchaeota archaeon]|nr:hypothetical protein [Candidatus Aenigmarchaeota archaeon]
MVSKIRIAGTHCAEDDMKARGMPGKPWYSDFVGKAYDVIRMVECDVPYYVVVIESFDSLTVTDTNGGKHVFISGARGPVAVGDAEVLS